MSDPRRRRSPGESSRRSSRRKSRRDSGGQSTNIVDEPRVISSSRSIPGGFPQDSAPSTFSTTGEAASYLYPNQQQQQQAAPQSSPSGAPITMRSSAEHTPPGAVPIPGDLNRPHRRTVRRHGSRSSLGSLSTSSSGSSSSSYLDISRWYPSWGRGGGVLKTFFKTPSEHRPRRRRSQRKMHHSESSSQKKKNKGVFVLGDGNSSSSSVNSDMAYGMGFIKKGKSRRGGFSPNNMAAAAAAAAVAGAAVGSVAGKSMRSGAARPEMRRRQTDEEILNIGRKLQDVARMQSQADMERHSKSSWQRYQRQSSSGVDAPVRGLSSSKSHRRKHHSSSSSSSSSDDDWESASEDEDSDELSALAYGHAPIRTPRPPKSTTSRMSTASAFAAGSALVAGSAIAAGAASRSSDRKSAVVDPKLFGPTNSLRDYVNTPCGFEGDISHGRYPDQVRRPGQSHDGYADSAESASLEARPLQTVYPVATSDPGRMEAARASGSVVTSSIHNNNSTTTILRDRVYSNTSGPSRAEEVPIQAPKPIAPVPSRMYDEEHIRGSVRAESPKHKDREHRRKPSSDDKRYAETALVGAGVAALGAAILAGRNKGKGKGKEEEDDQEVSHGRHEQYGHDDHRDDDTKVEDARKAQELRLMQEIERLEQRLGMTSKAREARRRDSKRDRDSVSRVDAPPADIQGDEDYERECERERRRSERQPRRSEPSDYDGRVKTPSERSTAIESGDRTEYRRVDDPSQPASSASNINVFQFQVSDDSFMTGSTPPKAPTPLIIDVTPMPSRSPSPASEQSKKIRLRDVYDKETRDAHRIYEEAHHSTAPIPEAVMAAAFGAVENSRRRRSIDRDNYDDGRGRTDSRAADAVQQEADKVYAARRLAEREMRSRSRSSTGDGRSVVGDGDDDDDDQIVRAPRIVTPPEWKNRPPKNDFGEPNADFRFDLQMSPTDLLGYRPPFAPVRDPSAERPRPMLNLVMPTPVPTPSPEAQREVTPAAKAAEEEPVKEVPTTGLTRSLRMGPRGEVIEVFEAVQEEEQPPTPPTTFSKRVSWGPSETKSYVEHSPERDDERPSSSASASKGFSGWGAIAAAVTGAGVGATLAQDREDEARQDIREHRRSSSGSRSPPKERPILPGISSRVFTDEPEELPPAPGPKPTSPRTSQQHQHQHQQQMPGSFGDDIDFAATLAAGLEHSGFDPEIVLENPEYHRRDSPPGSNEPYMQPFAETVSDLGIYSFNDGSEPLPFRDHGYVIGEVDTPSSENAAPLDKLEDVSHGSQSKRSSSAYNDIEVIEEPDTTEPDMSKLSKKECRKLEKAAQAAKMIEEEVQAAQQPPVVGAAEDEWADVSTGSPKKSKKSKRDSKGYDLPDDDQPVKDKRDRRTAEFYEPIADRDVSSVVSSNGRSNGDDDRSVASTPSESKRDGKRSSSSGGGFWGLLSGREQSSKKDNAGTLGAGAGSAGVAAVAIAAAVAGFNAAQAPSGKQQDEPHIETDAREEADVVFEDPEIVPRAIKPAIDPQYGDLLPLPPSPGEGALDFDDEDEVLPSLPDSRPGTPPGQPPAVLRERERERGSTISVAKRQHFGGHARRPSTDERPMRSPSGTAIPIQFRMGHRSMPVTSSAGGSSSARSSPMASPMVQQIQSPPTTSSLEGSPTFKRSEGSPTAMTSRWQPPRPTSWDSSRQIKPLYLLERSARPAGEEAALPRDEVVAEMTALPPSSEASTVIESQQEAEEETETEQAVGLGVDAGQLVVDTDVARSAVLESPEPTLTPTGPEPRPIEHLPVFEQEAEAEAEAQADVGSTPLELPSANSLPESSYATPGEYASWQADKGIETASSPQLEPQPVQASVEKEIDEPEKKSYFPSALSMLPAATLAGVGALLGRGTGEQGHANLDEHDSKSEPHHHSHQPADPPAAEVIIEASPESAAKDESDHRTLPSSPVSEAVDISTPLEFKDAQSDFPPTTTSEPQSEVTESVPGTPANGAVGTMSKKKKNKSKKKTQSVSDAPQLLNAAEDSVLPSAETSQQESREQVEAVSNTMDEPTVATDASIPSPPRQASRDVSPEMVAAEQTVPAQFTPSEPDAVDILAEIQPDTMIDEVSSQRESRDGLAPGLSETYLYEPTVSSPEVDREAVPTHITDLEEAAAIVPATVEDSSPLQPEITDVANDAPAPTSDDPLVQSHDLPAEVSLEATESMEPSHEIVARSPSPVNEVVHSLPLQSLGEGALPSPQDIDPEPLPLEHRHVPESPMPVSPGPDAGFQDVVSPLATNTEQILEVETSNPLELGSQVDGSNMPSKTLAEATQTHQQEILSADTAPTALEPDAIEEKTIEPQPESQTLVDEADANGREADLPTSELEPIFEGQQESEEPADSEEIARREVEVAQAQAEATELTRLQLKRKPSKKDKSRIKDLKARMQQREEDAEAVGASSSGAAQDLKQTDLESEDVAKGNEPDVGIQPAKAISIEEPVLIEQGDSTIITAELQEPTSHFEAPRLADQDTTSVQLADEEGQAQVQPESQQLDDPEELARREAEAALIRDEETELARLKNKKKRNSKDKSRIRALEANALAREREAEATSQRQIEEQTAATRDAQAEAEVFADVGQDIVPEPPGEASQPLVADQFLHDDAQLLVDPSAELASEAKVVSDLDCTSQPQVEIPVLQRTGSDTDIVSEHALGESSQLDERQADDVQNSIAHEQVASSVGPASEDKHIGDLNSTSQPQAETPGLDQILTEAAQDADLVPTGDLSGPSQPDKHQFGDEHDSMTHDQLNSPAELATETKHVDDLDSTRQPDLDTPATDQLDGGAAQDAVNVSSNDLDASGQLDKPQVEDGPDSSTHDQFPSPDRDIDASLTTHDQKVETSEDHAPAIPHENVHETSLPAVSYSEQTKSSFGGWGALVASITGASIGAAVAQDSEPKQIRKAEAPSEDMGAETQEDVTQLSPVLEPIHDETSQATTKDTSSHHDSQAVEPDAEVAPTETADISSSQIEEPITLAETNLQDKDITSPVLDLVSDQSAVIQDRADTESAAPAKKSKKDKKKKRKGTLSGDSDQNSGLVTPIETSEPVSGLEPVQPDDDVGAVIAHDKQVLPVLNRADLSDEPLETEQIEQHASKPIESSRDGLTENEVPGVIEETTGHDQHEINRQLEDSFHPTAEDTAWSTSQNLAGSSESKRDIPLDELVVLPASLARSVEVVPSSTGNVPVPEPETIATVQDITQEPDNPGHETEQLGPSVNDSLPVAEATQEPHFDDRDLVSATENSRDLPPETDSQLAAVDEQQQPQDEELSWAPARKSSKKDKKKKQRGSAALSETASGAQTPVNEKVAEAEPSEPSAMEPSQETVTDERTASNSNRSLPEDEGVAQVLDSQPQVDEWPPQSPSISKKGKKGKKKKQASTSSWDSNNSPPALLDDEPREAHDVVEESALSASVTDTLPAAQPTQATESSQDQEDTVLEPDLTAGHSDETSPVGETADHLPADTHTQPGSLEEATPHELPLKQDLDVAIEQGEDTLIIAGGQVAGVDLPLASEEVVAQSPPAASPPPTMTEDPLVSEAVPDLDLGGQVKDAGENILTGEEAVAHVAPLTSEHSIDLSSMSAPTPKSELASQVDDNEDILVVAGGEVVDDTVSQDIVSPEAIPQDTVPQEGVPQEGISHEPAPEEEHSQQAVDQEVIPRGVRQKGISQEAIQQEGLPQEGISHEAVLQDDHSQQAIHQDVIRQGVPEEVTSQEVAPQEFVLQGVVPQDDTSPQADHPETIPQEVVPQEVVPQEILPQESLLKEDLTREAARQDISEPWAYEATQHSATHTKSDLNVQSEEGDVALTDASGKLSGDIVEQSHTEDDTQDDSHWETEPINDFLGVDRPGSRPQSPAPWGDEDYSTSQRGVNSRVDQIVAQPASPFVQDGDMGTLPAERDDDFLSVQEPANRPDSPVPSEEHTSAFATPFEEQPVPAAASDPMPETSLAKEKFEQQSEATFTPGSEESAMGTTAEPSAEDADVWTPKKLTKKEKRKAKKGSMSLPELDATTTASDDLVRTDAAAESQPLSDQSAKNIGPQDSDANVDVQQESSFSVPEAAGVAAAIAAPVLSRNLSKKEKRKAKKSTSSWEDGALETLHPEVSSVEDKASRDIPILASPLEDEVTSRDVAEDVSASKSQADLDPPVHSETPSGVEAVAEDEWASPLSRKKSKKDKKKKGKQLSLDAPSSTQTTSKEESPKWTSSEAHKSPKFSDDAVEPTFQSTAQAPYVEEPPLLTSAKLAESPKNIDRAFETTSKPVAEDTSFGPSLLQPQPAEPSESPSDGHLKPDSSVIPGSELQKMASVAPSPDIWDREDYFKPKVLGESPSDPPEDPLGEFEIHPAISRGLNDMSENRNRDERPLVGLGLIHRHSSIFQEDDRHTPKLLTMTSDNASVESSAIEDTSVLGGSTEMLLKAVPKGNSRPRERSTDAAYVDTGYCSIFSRSPELEANFPVLQHATVPSPGAHQQRTFPLSPRLSPVPRPQDPPKSPVPEDIKLSQQGSVAKLAQRFGGTTKKESGKKKVFKYMHQRTNTDDSLFEHSDMREEAESKAAVGSRTMENEDEDEDEDAADFRAEKGTHFEDEASEPDMQPGQGSTPAARGKETQVGDDNVSATHSPPGQGAGRFTPNFPENGTRKEEASLGSVVESPILGSQASFEMPSPEPPRLAESPSNSPDVKTSQNSNHHHHHQQQQQQQHSSIADTWDLIGARHRRSESPQPQPASPALDSRDVGLEESVLASNETQHDLSRDNFIPPVDFRGSVSRGLPPVQEEPTEEETESGKHVPSLAMTTSHINRDSGFVTDSPHQAWTHRFEDAQQRDSGVHMRDHRDRSPGLLSSRGSSPDFNRASRSSVGSEGARLEDRPKQSPLARFEHRLPEDTPVLEAQVSPVTPEPQKSRSDGSRTHKYPDLGPRATTATALAGGAAALLAGGRRAGAHSPSLSPAAEGQTRRAVPNTSMSRAKTPEPLNLQPDSPGLLRHSATPPLRSRRTRSGDLRTLSQSSNRSVSDLGAGSGASPSPAGSATGLQQQQQQQPSATPAASTPTNIPVPASSSHPTTTTTATNSTSSSSSATDLRKAAHAALAAATKPAANPVANEGRVRTKDMADVYDGFGEGRMGSPRSPTRPHSMRRRQSMQVLDLENRVEQLLAENRALAEAKAQAELHSTNKVTSALADRDNEIDALKQSLDFMRKEIHRLTEVNEGLNSAISQSAVQHQDRYRLLETEHTAVAGELNSLRSQHGSYSQSIEDKDAEIRSLRGQLEATKEQVRELQRQILATNPAASEFLEIKDVDYFDHRCQQLCSHVQQWVLRFSKFSDMRACRLTSELNDEKIIDRLDNAVLDGSNVDNYLNDRVKRRDIFMSVAMTMIWEFVFTRYLFGMDREQRQKLKILEKLLLEVGPPKAVRQWRAVTLTLLSKREAYKDQREQDTEAVVQAVFQTLSMILPPPSNLEEQIQGQLRKVMREAVELSIEMRTQRAEYMMLPPLQPEYDASGDLAEPHPFNAQLMSERSAGADKDKSNDDDLQAEGAIVRVVLFPLVVKKGDDEGVGDDEVVVCPAQVIVKRPGRSSSRRSMRAPSSDAGGVSLLRGGGSPSTAPNRSNVSMAEAEYIEGGF